MLVFAAYMAERHNVEIDDTGELLGIDAQRLRRCRLRLKQSYRTDSVEAVLTQMGRRFSRIPVPHPRPDWDLRGEMVPLYEAVSL